METVTRLAVQWAVPFALGLVSGFLVKLFGMVRATQKALRALLRSRLLDLHERFVVSGEGCPDWAKRDAEQAYEAYHALGGNGVGTHYYEEIVDAPVRGVERG